MRFLFLITFSSVLFGTIINVPTDQPTIQIGINAAVIGDTVLVQPGIYYENIDFNGKNIVVASLFVINQDPSIISQTVINGSEEGRVVTFTQGEDSTATLNGFTIENGFIWALGGGIYCSYNSSPSLMNLIVTGNVAQSGGGIYCAVSSPKIENVTIFNNTAYANGGGLYFYYNSNAKLVNVNVYDNFAYSNGSGIYCYYSNPTITNSTISMNFGGLGSGIYCSNSNPIITNSIFWQNSPQEIYLESGFVNITYSDIQGGWEGEGNISENPLFCDLNNYVFTIAENSPCVGTGFNGANMGAFGIGCDSLTVFVGPVWHVSNSGSDITGDGSQDNPYATIQQAILFTNTGDTVLVQPGIYSENINFYGRKIVVGSLILTTNDASIISQTIINSNTSASVITFENGEDSTTILNGFTITNGHPWDRGGGIKITNSSPYLKNLLITQNWTQQNGGGIYCDNSNTILENVIISDNSSIYSGGGIFCANSNLRIRNMTLIRNSSPEVSGIFSFNSNLEIINSILWNNFPHEISVPSGSVNITYSDVRGGWQGEGNINENPLFCDPNNLIFTLAANSPCLGSGYEGVVMGALGAGCDSITVIQGPIWHVSNTGSDDTGDGTHDNPFETIQWGIFNSNVGDTVLVHPGTYSENLNYYGKNVVVASYFLPTDSTAYIEQTIIDGGQSGPVVVFESGENSTTELIGFTIINGQAEAGGGIYCNQSSPSLSHLVITDNIAIETGGGGIYCSYNANPQISNVTLYGNSADNGGAIYCLDARPVISNSILWNNFPQEIYYDPNGYQSLVTVSYSDVRGGEEEIETNNNGLVNWLDGNINLYPLFCDPDSGNFALAENSYCVGSGENGVNIGALDVNCDSTTVNRSIWYVSTTGSDSPINGSESNPLSSIQFAINASSENDTVLLLPGTYPENINYNGKNIIIGSLFLTTGDTSYISETIISGNQSGSVVTFNHNEGITSVLMGLTITNGSASEGGGIYFNHSAPYLQNVVVTGNTATTGGGIFCDSSANPSLMNITISANSAVYGGAVFCSASNPIIVNMILWDNTPQEIYFKAEGNPGTITVANSDIRGGEGGIITNNNGTVIWLGGNINADPLFCVPDSSDYSLAENSPCIRSGTTDMNMGALNVGCGLLTTSDEFSGLPLEFVLYQNYPNPFNPTTTIRYELPKAGSVRLEVYNILGQKVATLVDGYVEAGFHRVRFNSSQLTSGTYFYTLETPGYKKIRKMIFLK